MVSYDNSWIFESFSSRISTEGPYRKNGCQENFCQCIHHPMKPGFPATTTDRQQVQQDNAKLQHQTPEQKIEKGIDRFKGAHQGVGQSIAGGLP